MNHNYKSYFILGALAMVSALIYVLTILDKEEVIKHNRRKGYVIRRSIIGAVGSAIGVWLSFEIAVYFGMPDSFALAIAGFVGFLGADTISRIIEYTYTKYIEHKFPSQPPHEVS